MAQEDGKAVRNGDGIADIIVTAERRETSIQKTAISITALSGEEIIKRNLNSVDNILREVPSVVLQGNANGAYVYIRGIGSQQDTAIGGPSVNMNFDGVYQQQTDAPFSSIYDLERIEVLRGPQGTLYGRNATAGSINIITASPTLDGVHARGSFSYGNYDAVRAEAALNVPLGSTIAVRFAGMINRHDGYIQPSGYDDADDTGVRAKLLWQPSSAVKLVLGTEYLHVGGVGNGAVDPLATHPDDAYYSTAPTGITDLSYRRYYGELNADLGFGTLTILPAIQRYEKFDNNVIINYPTPAATSSAGGVNETQHTLETRLASNAGSPFTWLIGGYYLHAMGTNPYYVSRISVPNNPLTYPYLSGSDTKSYAAFGQVTVPLTERFRATAGLRFTHDRKSLTRQASATAYTKPTSSFDSVTYKAGFEYDAAPRTMVYANISSGFKAGGLDQNYNSYRPEKLRAIQGGVKSRFLENRLQINAEAFHYSYKDFQAQYGYRCQNSVACPTILNFANTIVNAGSAKVYGGELEILAEPVRHGRFTGSLGYTHSRFDRLVIVPGTANNSPAGCATITTAHPTYTCTVQANQILTGEALANAPKWTVSAGYEQGFELPNGHRITLQGDTRYTSGYWTLYRRPPQVPAESFQSGFFKVNASISYSGTDDAWSVRAFVRNLTNKAVVTSAVGSSLTLAPPRTYGVQFSGRF
ncbi:TonB-dependent receptor [Sphingobium sp.]|uniref:TonB-dependent receptor n=1 Tax=Sphingobium sp. TaxID=1912891 RepID=UPI0028BD4F46|nr:TonB-dependent receptor [Sphingobium sp.]